VKLRMLGRGANNGYRFKSEGNILEDGRLEEREENMRIILKWISRRWEIDGTG
jgi:membrane-bound lytic murein transglycosylase